MLKAIIVDDEILAVKLIENLLREKEEVEIVGVCNDAKDVIKMVERLNPHIVFLDIEMPGDNGITVAEEITKTDENIEIIFVTAYEGYAIEAFRVHAANYLLKPINKQHLYQTINRIMKRKNIHKNIPKDNTLLKAQMMGNFILYNKLGEPIKWRTKKVKELCVLLLHYRKPIHRTQIIENLWPEYSLEKSTTILHTTVYQLRKELKSCGYSEPILYSNECYSLNISIHIDESMFPLELDYAIDSEELLSLIDKAIKGYLGDEDYIWTIGYGEKIKEKTKQIFDKYVIYHIDSDKRPNQWRSILEKLIEFDSFDEMYYRELIKYYIETQNISKANLIYKRLETLLWNELKTKPSEETEKVLKQMK
ncbi:response regulator receiver and SARP domain containing protein [Clostridium aceticum]|uniref:Stage 0 sporulation protein A homolog n=1 Tax=Clostridium aceticum TaxID=84022 RepID=A0A0D8I7S9_9CLOT|nr:response regulator [Clostridium aceticum]AKL97295.1 response regulator receiver and SARP domain containing protein [Clostridium aceticum]KJF26313.1 hypothetical protein TZ02_14190 [Clostridium aceticum]